MDANGLAWMARRVLPIVAANGVTLLRQNAHIKTGLPLSKPNMIYVAINNICNLRCLYCDIWKYKGEDDLSTEEWLRIFDELLTWTKHPKLNIAGGEPFIRKDIFELLRYTVEKGAVVGVVSNGWAIRPSRAKEVVGLGLSNLNISLDSLDPAVCDMMRGRDGHTEQTIESVLRVMDELGRQRSNTKVYLKTVVCGANAGSLVPLVEFAAKHGITGVTFQPLEAVFSKKIDYGDEWFKNTPLWPQTMEPLDDAIAQLIEMKKAGAPIMNPISHIASWPAYFRDPINGARGQLVGDDVEQTERTPCRVGHSHLYINANGTFKLCWSFDKLGDARFDSIPKMWASAQAEQLREEIAECKEPCTKTCLLDRSVGETARTFLTLMKPR